MMVNNLRVADDLNGNNNFKEIVSKLSYHEAKELLAKLEEIRKRCEEKKVKFRKEFYDVYSRVISRFTDLSYAAYELRRDCERCLQMIKEIEDCLVPRSEILIRKREIMTILFVIEMLIELLEREEKK